MRIRHMLLFVVASAAYSQIAAAALINPPIVNWPTGWEISQPPPPPEAQGLDGAQVRAVLSENGRVLAVMGLVYARVDNDKSLDKDLKDANDYSITLAKRSGMKITFGPPFDTHIGALQARATEGTLTLQSRAGSRIWSGVTRKDDKVYTFVYSAPGSNYEKYMPLMKETLSSFQANPSEPADFSKAAGEYAAYIIAACLLIFIGWRFTRKSPSSNPPPIP